MLSKEQQIQNSFIYSLQMGVSTLLPIITLPIFTRLLTKESYGLLALAYVYATFMAGVMNFGLLIVYERNYFQCKERQSASELLYSIMAFQCVLFLICLGVTFLFKETLARWIMGSSLYANLLFWAFIATAVSGLKMYYLAYLKNSTDAKGYTRYLITESVLSAVISLVLVVYGKAGVLGIVWGQLLSSALVLVMLTLKFVSLLPFSFNWTSLKDSLKLGFPLTPRIFLKITGTQSDKYLMGLLSSTGMVGIYSIGQKISYMVFSWMTAIENAFSPQVYRKMFELGEEGHASVGRYLTPYAYASVACALAISLFSEEVIGVLTPPPYHGAVNVVIVFSMFYAILFFGKQPQILFAKKTHVISLLTFFSIALTIGLNIPFILTWGAIGAAWATLVAGLISGGVSFAVSQRYYPIHWEYKKIVAMYVILFAASISLLLLRGYGIDYNVKIVVKLMFLACYLYLGIRLHVVTKENGMLVKNMVLKRLSPLLVADQT